MGLDLQKLTKSLHGLTELKMTLQSVILFQKCNKSSYSLNYMYTVNVVLAMKIQTVCYEIFYMISAHIWISHNALL